MITISKELITKLRISNLTVAVTGSGISADSGIPTFRDAQSGIWSKFRPEDLATAEAFSKNPSQVWDWYDWRRQLVAQAQPNAGHEALAKMEGQLKRLELITQNVDGLHQRAGSTSVIEFHGNINQNNCFIQNRPIDVANENTSPPICGCCGGWVRPGVVWFGEAIDEENLNRAFDFSRNCDVMISIGTSSQVYPAAGLIEVALQNEITTVEVNPNRTPFSGMVDYFFQGSAAEILPQIAEGLN